MKPIVTLLVIAVTLLTANSAQAAPLANRSFEQALLPSWVTEQGTALTISNFFGVQPSHGNQMMRQDAVGRGATLVNSSLF